MNEVSLRHQRHQISLELERWVVENDLVLVLRPEHKASSRVIQNLLNIIYLQPGIQGFVCAGQACYQLNYISGPYGLYFK